MKSRFLGLALTVLIFPLSGAQAATPTPEVRQLARVLVNNPEITRQLKENSLDALMDLMITNIKEGVDRYEMRFVRQCECIPATGRVKIVEDRRPTATDGAIKYTSSIEISEK